MKVLLSTTPTEGEYLDWTTPKVFYHYKKSGVKYMPLGILSLATNIEEGCDVKVIDPASENWGIDETIERIEKENADVVGLSVVSQRAYPMKRILGSISAKYKVVGGPHATHYNQQILKQGADAVFVGQLADNEFKEAIKIQPKGVVYCDTKINNIKFPKRDFVDFESYFFKGKILFEANNRMAMFSSMGCPYSCVFCDVQTKKQQRKHPEAVVDEMQYLKSLGSRSIHVLDDNFNISEKHVNRILDVMDEKRFNIEWSSRGQAKISGGLAKRLAEHNFKRIHVGIEAVDNDILKYFRKVLNVNDVHKFCEIMNDNNIDVLGYFIVGTPVETEEYLAELPNKIRELGIKHSWFNILFPLPNTEYYSNLLNNNFYKKDYWAEYMENPTPDFTIPFPLGEKRLEKILNYVKNVSEELR